MLCDYKPTGEIRDGRERNTCNRPGCITPELWVPLGNNIRPANCRGIPLPHEYREWLALFSEAAGIPRALAIVAYIRWRAKGSPIDQLPPGVPNPQLIVPRIGPGTELKKILASLGVSTCGTCQAWADQMNLWGIAGCCEHREEILSRLRQAYDESDLLTKLRAAGNAVTHGLPLTLEGLLELAIERAS